MPLELPCRGTRLGEELPYARSVVDLACQIVDCLGREALLARPFALLGHSFGAWVAYEICQELRRRADQGWPAPLKLYVSACRAPQLAGGDHDADRQNPTIGSLSADAFWEAFERRYGCNPDLRSPYIRGFVGNILQADFSLLEAYQPSTLEPLSIPICALCARGDTRCLPEQLSSWKAVVAEDEDNFRERWFADVLKPGGWATEHRYITDNPASVIRFLHTDLPLVGRPIDGDLGMEGPLDMKGSGGGDVATECPSEMRDSTREQRPAGCSVM